MANRTLTTEALKAEGFTDEQIKTVMSMKGQHITALEQELEERDKDTRGEATDQAEVADKVEKEVDRADERKGEERHLEDERREATETERPQEQKEEEQRVKTREEDRREVERRDERHEEERKENEDVSKLRKRIAELEQEKSEGERRQRVRNSISTEDVYNPDTLLRLLDLDSLNLTEEAIEGLEDQLIKLRESDPYLFKEKESETRQAGTHVTTSGNRGEISMNDRIRGMR